MKDEVQDGRHAHDHIAMSLPHRHCIAPIAATLPRTRVGGAPPNTFPQRSPHALPSSTDGSGRLAITDRWAQRRHQRSSNHIQIFSRPWKTWGPPPERPALGQRQNHPLFWALCWGNVGELQTPEPTIPPRKALRKRIRTCDRNYGSLSGDFCARASPSRLSPRLRQLEKVYGRCAHEVVRFGDVGDVVMSS